MHKYIDYRARIGVDEFAPVDAYEYAKEQLRYQILNDNKFQEEIIKNNNSLKDYVCSRIDGLERHLEKLNKTSLFFALIKGDSLRTELNQTYLRIEDLKGIIEFIDYQNKVLKYQIERTENPELLTNEK